MDWLIEIFLRYVAMALGIVAFIIYIFIRDKIKTRFNIEYIVEDINRIFNMGFNAKSVKKLVYSKNKIYKKIFQVEDLFTHYLYKEYNNMLYRRVSHQNEIQLAYNIININHTFSQYSFSFELYDHCEKRVIDERNSEHKYMHNCLKSLLSKNKYHNNLIKCLCRVLLKIDYYFWEDRYHSSVSLSRMISYVEKAKKECSDYNYSEYKYEEEEFEELCTNYIEELKAYWDEYIKH